MQSAKPVSASAPTTVFSSSKAAPSSGSGKKSWDLSAGYLARKTSHAVFLLQEVKPVSTTVTLKSSALEARKNGLSGSSTGVSYLYQKLQFICTGLIRLFLILFESCVIICIWKEELGPISWLQGA